MANSSGEGFPTTDWKLVQCAGTAQGQVRRDALGSLLTRYFPALKTHLITRRQMTPHQAEDTLQEFLLSKIIEADLVARARTERGKFRNLLRKALDDFAISRRRHDLAKKRSPENFSNFSEAECIADGVEDPQWAFDVAWAREVLAEGVRRTQAECEQSQRPDLWDVFECRVLSPIVEGSAPPSYETLIKGLGFRSPLQAANALTTAKRMFERNLREVLAEYAGDENQVDEEIRDLREILARSGR